MSQEQLTRKKSSKAFKNGFIGGLWEEQSLLPEELELWP